MSCKVATDEAGESKGFGFVQFADEESAQKAINNCNKIEFYNKEIFVGPFIRSN